MNYLAIDTSGTHLTVLLRKNGEVFEYFNGACGLFHSNVLLDTIEELLKKANASLSDIDCFACVVGAGSFTGIRIGVATIKAMCFAFNKPSVAVTSFDTMAYNLNEKVMAVIDAKHGSFYACGYEGESVTEEPCFLSEEQLTEKAQGFKLISGFKIDGIDTEIVDIKEGLKKAVERKIERKDLIFDQDGLSPLYIRKSQAEENR